MKSVSISGSSRANVGTKDAKAVRAAGQIPCVLYGGTEQIHFQAEEKVFKPLIYTPEVKYRDWETADYASHGNETRQIRR